MMNKTPAIARSCAKTICSKKNKIPAHQVSRLCGAKLQRIDMRRSAHDEQNSVSRGDTILFMMNKIHKYHPPLPPPPPPPPPSPAPP